MLTLQVKEQIIENLTPDEKFIRGTVGAKCQIKFDEFWGKYEKTVVFQRKCQKPINIIVNELDNEIEIPYEILEKHGKFKIGVFGIIENEVLPTLWSKDIEILCGTDTHGTNPQMYTPSEIDQLRLSKQNKLIAGQGIKIEKDVISIDGEIGVQPDWNQSDETRPDYIKNRTHYEETTVINEPLNLTWDGNTEGLVSVLDLYKVSDLVLTDEQIKSGTAYLNIGESASVLDVWDEAVANGAVTTDVVGLGNVVLFARKDGAMLYDTIIPEQGIYFMSSNDADVYLSAFTTTEPVEHTKTIVHKIDPKYLPDGLPYTTKGIVTLANEVIDCFDAGEYRFDGSFEIVIGQTYTVIFNEMKYECVGFEDEGYPALGSTYNSVVEGVAEALPFCIWTDTDSEGNHVFLYPKVEGSHAIQILTEGEIVHKLDPKYLPETTKTKPDWNQNDAAQPDYIENRTHFDINLDDITWDNSINYNIKLDYTNEGTSEFAYYKVSNVVPMVDVLVGGVYVYGNIENIIDTSDIIDDVSTGIISCGYNSWSGGAAFKVVYDSDKAGVPNGVYFFKGSNFHFGTSSETTKLVFPKVKKLDEKYLPVNNFADKDYVDEKNLSTTEQSQEYSDSCDIRETRTGGFVTMLDIATKEKMTLSVSNSSVETIGKINFYDKVVGYADSSVNMVLTDGTGIANPDSVRLYITDCHKIVGDNMFGVNWNVISENRNTLMCQIIFTVDDYVNFLRVDVQGEYSGAAEIYCELQPNVEYQLLYNISCSDVYEDYYGECFDGSANDITIIKSSDIKKQVYVGTNKLTLENDSSFSIPTMVCVPSDISAGTTFKGKYQTWKPYDFIKDEIEKNTTLSIEGNDDLPTPILKLDGGSEPITLYWDGTVATSFSSTATGTENDPIIINTAAELAYLINKATNTTGKYYKIADGISAIVLQSSDKSKDITALSTEAAVKTYFESNNCTVWRGSIAPNTFDGNFDGNGATIYGLYIKETSYSGLFSTLGGNSTIKNLTIKNSYFKTGWYAGVVASNIADNGGGTVAIEKCVITNCCVVGKYNFETDTGVKSIPNQCIGLMLGRANNIDNTTISINNCLVYGNNVHYEYDNSINNYLIGFSKYTKIKNSVMLNFDDLVFNGMSAETLNVYTDKEITNIEDIKGEKAITKMPNLAWGINWFVPKTYTGKAAPFDFLQLSQATLLNSMNNNTIEINNKTITSTSTKEKYTFDWNAMYLIKSNSGNVDISLYNSDTKKVIVDGDGNDLPESSLCLLILPKSSTGVGGGRLCMFVGMTGNFSLLSPNVLKGLQFNVASGDVYFTPSTSASIFKIAL